VVTGTARLGKGVGREASLKEADAINSDSTNRNRMEAGVVG